MLKRRQHERSRQIIPLPTDTQWNSTEETKCQCYVYRILSLCCAGSYFHKFCTNDMYEILCKSSPLLIIKYVPSLQKDGTYIYICLCFLCIVICMHRFHSAHVFKVCNSVIWPTHSIFNYGHIVKLYSHFVYSPLNSYVYIHWILDFKYILLLLLLKAPFVTKLKSGWILDWRKKIHLILIFQDFVYWLLC